MSLVRITAVALVALTLGSVGTAAAQDGPPAGTPVVYINSQEVVQAAPGAAEAQRTFQRELDEWQTDLRTDAAVLDSLFQDYRRQEVMLSPQAKEQKQTELRGRQQELTTKQQELETRAQQRQGELLQPILDRVTRTIEQLRAERNYAIILDSQSPGVVAADPALDVTGLVIQRLGGAAPAQAPGGTP
jgi:outer membrane protein